MNRITSSISRWAAIAAVGTALVGTSAWAQQNDPQAISAAQAHRAQALATQTTPHAHHAPHLQQRQQRHQQMHEQHLTRMKNLLQITPQQQAAWDAYVAAAHSGPQKMTSRPKADWHNMNTLQRLDARAQMRQEHQAAAQQRDQATRTFYNSLSSAQQKAFDSLPTQQRPVRKPMRPRHF